MDNFKHHSKRPKRSSSLDGIFGEGSLSLERRGQSGRRRENNLDNFRKSDGFRPARSGSLTAKTSRLSDNRRARRSDDGQVDLDLPKAKPKKHHPRSSRLARFSKRTASLATVLVVVFAGYLFGKAYLRALEIFAGGGGAAALEENVDPSQLRGEGDGRVNILLLGKGGPGHEAPDLTDTILIASIDPIHKEAALLSIPRDFYIPGTTNSKINAVYSDAKQRALAEGKNGVLADRAGLAAISTTLEGVLGIPIHYHTMIDFTGFEKAINTVGGIDINVEDPLYDLMHINGVPYILDVKKGQQHFDGTRALMYSRSRKTSPRGDFDRSERQRAVLVALKDKVFSIGTFGNPIKINQLLDAFGSHIRTNLTVSEMLRVYEIGGGILSDKIDSISLVDEPNVLIVGANINGAVQVPKAGHTNYSEIQSFVRNRLKDGFLREENATVAVYNGTQINGLAASTAAELKSYGYSVSEIANSPIKNQQSTILVDLRGGQKKYTKAYLEKRFGVTATSTLPDSRIDPGTADFVIILGQNEQTRLQQ